MGATSQHDVEVGWQSVLAWAILVFGGAGVYGLHAWAVRPDPPPPPLPPPRGCEESAEVISHSDSTRTCEGGGVMTVTPLSDGLLAVHCSCPSHTPLVTSGGAGGNGGAP
jgi:hypothetical protein